MSAYRVGGVPKFTITAEIDGKRYQMAIEVAEYRVEYGIREGADDQYCRTYEHNGRVDLRIGGRVLEGFHQIEIPQVFPWF
jgi:hypothetical protein